MFNVLFSLKVLQILIHRNFCLFQKKNIEKFF